MATKEILERELDLAEKLLKLANIQVDTALKTSQRAFLPWQFMLGGLATGAGIVSAFFAIVKWQLG